MGLDMARQSLETSGALIKVAIDVDMTEFPALETDLMVAGMISSKGHVMVTASLPDFSVGDSNFLFFGQG